MTNLPLTHKASLLIAQENIHGNHFRKGIKIPYMTHLYEVMKRVVRYGIKDDEILASALLHDFIEDTDGCYDDLKNMFSKRVADIVQECSREVNDGETRSGKLKFLESFANKSSESVVIKIADRYCNVMDYYNEGKSNYAAWYTIQAFPLYRKCIEDVVVDFHDDIAQSIINDISTLYFMSYNNKDTNKYKSLHFNKEEVDENVVQLAYEYISEGPVT